MLDQANVLMIESQSRVAQEQKDMETLLSTFTESIEDQQSLNFSQDNNVVPKKEMKRRSDYSNTKVKTKNLPTNVSYRRFKQSDFHKNNFIIDKVSFLVQSFNAVNFDIKLDTDKERETVKFLWDEYTPVEFVQFIYKYKHFTQISQPSLTYQKAKPKKPVLPPIGQRQLSQQLQKIFPDVDSTTEKTSETFKEQSEDIDELIKKLGETDENADQVTFLLAEKKQKFDSFIKKYGLTNKNMLFVEF